MQSTNIKTTSELMSIALQAEREAIRRYSQLASSMRKGNNDSAAALFERMVVEEQEHESLLIKWMEQEGIEEDPNSTPVSWQDPQVATVYNDEARDPLYSSPYKALAFAVHNEEIAFRFYTHVAADSENSAVRKYAETLAREELGHAALLRAERRLAYHAEREANSTVPSLNPKAINTKADLLAAAIHIDQYLSDEIDSISSDSLEIEALARETQQQIINNERALQNETSPGEEVLRNLEELKAYNTKIKKQINPPGSGLQRLWACCDRSFAFYDKVVEEAEDETLMLTAQQLSASALDRIGILKRIVGEL